jgi:hypothetical protein
MESKNFSIFNYLTDTSVLNKTATKEIPIDEKVKNDSSLKLLNKTLTKDCLIEGKNEKKSIIM